MHAWLARPRAKDEHYMGATATLPPPACAAVTTTPGPWGLRGYRQYLATRFGDRHIRKLCLHAGFSCPNIDGSRGQGGCVFCNNAGFVPKGRELPDLHQQWNRGRAALRRRHRHVDGFIAYFQAFSNTHGPLDRLRRLLEPLPQDLPECVGVSISTRPDCLDDAVLDIIAALAKRCFVTLELGLQSDRDRVLRLVRRGHAVACFDDAVQRAAARGIELCAHVMLGLPGEGDDAPERLGRHLAALPVRSIKIHNLHIMRHTALERPFLRGALADLGRHRYAAMVARLIRHLRPDQYLQRVIADAPDDILLSAPWCHDKQGFLTDLRNLLQTTPQTPTTP